MLLDEMKENYLGYVELRLSNGTFRCYKNHLEFILNWFKKRNILDSNDITLKNLTSYILDEHKRGVKDSTINKRLKPLKLMFKYNEIVNEILEFKTLKEETSTFTALTTYELSTLVNYINNSKMKLQNKLIIFLLVDTGIRVNELLNIKCKNINFSNNTILLDITKTKKNRTVPFTEATALLLKQYLNDYEEENLIPINQSSIGSLFNRIKKCLNLNKLHPHMLRHTLASKLHKNGVSIIMIKQIMGHTNVTTTERYIHFDLDDLVEVYNSVM